MAITAFIFTAYDLGSFRVLFAADLTAPVGVTYLDGGTVLQHDTVPSNEAFAFRNALRRQGYAVTEVLP